MNRVRAIVVIVLVGLAVGTPSPARQVPEAWKDLAASDPLSESHLVVRGRVEAIAERAIPLKAFGIDRTSDRSGNGLRAHDASIAVGEVLRGHLNSKRLKVTVLHGVEFFEVGKEMVICARWLPRAGAYFAGTHLGAYGARRPEQWVKLGHVEDIGEGEVLTDGKLRERVHSGSIRAVAVESDVVARGRVVAAWTKEYSASENRVGVTKHYRLRVSQAFKGAMVGSEIEFVVPSLEGTYVPSWWRSAPTPGEGEEWFVFLRRGEQGLYPFSGTNSLLKVTEGKLKYDAIADCGASVEEAAIIIMGR